MSAGDALAVAERATRTMMQYDAAEDPEVASRYREELLRDIRVTVTSRDPQAVLTIGGLLTNPSLVENPEAGFAWWAAVCQMGYDCSNANPSGSSRYCGGRLMKVEPIRFGADMDARV